jgi:hypothetical protein
MVGLASAVALLFGLGALAQQPAPQKPSIDPALAATYFAEAKAASDKDGGKLWGQKVYGAMLFVDEATRDVAANRPDLQGLLKVQGDVFSGKLPPQENVANTAARWAGVSWTMLHWPLPEDAFLRQCLMIHECFHRIQEDLGLSGSDPSCDHLDTRDGRVWLQLEWRALRAALSSSGEARKKAVQDALLFRAFRRSLFPGADAKELALEIHEGLPEYTGVVLAAKNRAEAEYFAAGRLAGAASLQTFVRSFAYLTGPAYGLLLDDSGTPWRQGLKPQDDLSALLVKALSVTLPDDLKAAAAARAGAYGGKELQVLEDERAKKKAGQLALFKAQFVEGPVLALPTSRSFSYTFDPTDLVPLDGLGTVYPSLRVSAEWGILQANAGALLVLKEGFIQGVRVTAPKDPSARPLKGDGWTLDLKPGWALVPGARPGDWSLAGSPLAGR